MIKLLINNGASPKTRKGIPRKSPMQLAAAGGHLEVMEELAKHGYDWIEVIGVGLFCMKFLQLVMQKQ